MSKSEGPFKSLTIEKGVTLKTGDNYRRTTYTLEVDLSTGAKVDVARKTAENMIDQWLDEEKSLLETTKEVSGIPQIDIAELGACDWQTFQKQKAQPDEAAWVKNPIEFTSWKDPPNVLLVLAKALKQAQDQKLVLGDMEYSFSGTGDVKDHFISRRPVRVK